MSNEFFWMILVKQIKLLSSSDRTLCVRLSGGFSYSVMIHFP
jgi:hypothetical protein